MRAGRSIALSFGAVAMGILMLGACGSSGSSKSSSASNSTTNTTSVPVAPTTVFATPTTVSVHGVIALPSAGCTVVRQANGSLIGLGQDPGSYPYEIPIRPEGGKGAIVKSGAPVANVGDTVTVQGPVFGEGTDMNCSGHVTTKRTVIVANVTKN